MPDDFRRDVLNRWMERNDRGPTWLAKKTGYTRAYISRVLNGHDPFTEKLATKLEKDIGVSLTGELDTGLWSSP
jgi:plasmid maintenance system antidote protein VapI